MTRRRCARGLARTACTNHSSDSFSPAPVYAHTGITLMGWAGASAPPGLSRPKNSVTSATLAAPSRSCGSKSGGCVGRRRQAGVLPQRRRRARGLPLLPSPHPRWFLETEDGEGEGVVSVCRCKADVAWRPTTGLQHLCMHFSPHSAAHPGAG